MKIGIITLNGNRNYGNKLQNYALQKFLKSLSNSIDVDTIWYTKDNYILNKKFITLKNFRRFIFNRHNLREYFLKNIYANDIVREYNIKKFNDKFINIVYDYEIKPDLNERYDYFIAGSDQIWNFNYLNLENEFLKFAEKKKRIAYAASFGLSKVADKYKNIVREGVSNIKFVSVREYAGAKIIKDLTGRDVPVVVDPTLLLTKENWQEIMEKPVWFKDEKYLLIFFLDEAPPKVKKLISGISQKYKLNVINLTDKENTDYYTSSPSEFLYLINNASLIVTDSFHASVFSILTKKPFISCTKGGTGMNIDSRIDTLLSMFHLENSKISKDNNYEIANPMVIEFPDVEAILERERQRSKEFLCKALNIKG